MRQLAFLTIVLGASVASASPALARLPSKMPARCVPLAVIPASATISGPAFSAHVSVANCLAEDAMNAAAASPDDAAIARLDAAVAPSLAILDDVIRVGDAPWRLAAEKAKRDIYVSMIVRERITVPGIDVAGHAALEPKLARWQREETEADTAIAQLTSPAPQTAHR